MAFVGMSGRLDGNFRAQGRGFGFWIFFSGRGLDDGEGDLVVIVDVSGWDGIVGVFDAFEIF